LSNRVTVLDSAERPEGEVVGGFWVCVESVGSLCEEDRLVRCRGGPSLFNRFEDLLYDSRVQGRPAVERYSYAERALAVNPMAALRPKMFEAGESRPAPHRRQSTAEA